MEGFVTEILTPLQSLFTRVAVTMPSIIAAIVLLLIGALVSRALRALVERILRLGKIDEYSEKIGLNEILARLGLGRSPVYVIGFLIYWLIMLAFLVSAANAVNLTVVSELLQRFALFIPKLIASVLVMSGGLLVGHFLGEVVNNALVENKIKGAALLAKITKMVVVIFSVIIALEQLGIATTILTTSIQIVLGTLGLAFAIAFGLGGRDVAGELLRNLLKK